MVEDDVVEDPVSEMKLVAPMLWYTKDDCIEDVLLVEPI